MAHRVTAAFSVALFGAEGALLPGERDWTGYSFEQFQVDFGKNAKSEVEAATRRERFETNLALILEHNRNPSKSWFMTVNGFADWSLDEFRVRRVHGARKAAWRGVAETVSAMGGTEALPESLDWRDTTGVVTPVKDQGGCGSCWAFSATQTLESSLALATKSAAPVLSPQQLVSCSPNPDHCGGTGGCDGSTQELAFNYTKSVGLSTEASYPYRGETGSCDEGKIKAVVQNDGYVLLPKNNYTALMNAVASKGPIAISLAAGSSGWQFYGGGVLTSCDWIEDHAVQLVGYGSAGGKGYWLVRNSWGASWGEEGYIRIQRFGEGKEPCGMDTSPGDGSACAGDDSPVKVCGLCGILTDSSYPTGVKAVGPLPPAPTPAPSPTPTPTPTPTPSPSPAPTRCTAALASDCEEARDDGDPSVCRGCAMSFAGDMDVAGCTEDDIDGWCASSAARAVEMV